MEQLTSRLEEIPSSPIFSLMAFSLKGQNDVYADSAWISYSFEERCS